MTDKNDTSLNNHNLILMVSFSASFPNASMTVKMMNESWRILTTSELMFHFLVCIFFTKNQPPSVSCWGAKDYDFGKQKYFKPKFSKAVLSLSHMILDVCGKVILFCSNTNVGTLLTAVLVSEVVWNVSQLRKRRQRCEML